ncbi:hypothetical protein R5R35_005056 [Gryllus longicercus]|uniref:Uncharacterized protein n=1 Tax=Gryllus longicercus TaxID=2509291 RepID=A0AAN9W1R6_9ORTH
MRICYPTRGSIVESPPARWRFVAAERTTSAPRGRAAQSTSAGDRRSPVGCWLLHLLPLLDCSSPLRHQPPPSPPTPPPPLTHPEVERGAMRAPPRASLLLLLVVGVALALAHAPAPAHANGEAEGAGGSNYRHEMRSALSTIAAIIRAVADKLERHEVRERQLGDQLRRGQQALEKRSRAQEGQAAAQAQLLQRVDERLRALERTIAQNQASAEERLAALAAGQEAAAAQLRECQLAAADAHNALAAARPAAGAGAAAEAETAARLERVSQALDKAARGHADAARAAAAALAAAETRMRAVAADAQGLLDRYETRLNELSPVPTGAETDWHALFLSALEAHGASVKELAARSADAAAALAQLPGREDAAAATNATLRAVEAARAHLAADADKAAHALQRAVEQARAEGVRGREDILQALNEQAEQADRIADRSRQGYEDIHKQVLALRSAEKVLIQTADHVMDTKRGVEYGVHQILLETGEVVKAQAKLLNATLHRRFDGISGTILEHQTGALTNLSSKIEAEISQVWRQIGIMYQELSASTTALDRLQAQTESYVNGSALAMDSMEGKVGAIRERMNEVDENLNYLLGKLSLFSSEFGQVRTGLGEALDSIRTTFQEAQSAIRDAGPGPNPVAYDIPPE